MRIQFTDIAEMAIETALDMLGNAYEVDPRKEYDFLQMVNRFDLLDDEDMPKVFEMETEPDGSMIHLAVEYDSVNMVFDSPLYERLNSVCTSMHIIGGNDCAVRIVYDIPGVFQKRS